MVLGKERSMNHTSFGVLGCAGDRLTSMMAETNRSLMSNVNSGELFCFFTGVPDASVASDIKRERIESTAPYHFSSYSVWQELELNLCFLSLV